MANYSNGYTLPSGLNSSTDVKLLQQYLKNSGYQIDTGVTGAWDDATNTAYTKYLEAAKAQGAAEANPDIAIVEGAPEAYNTVGLVKAYQRQYGLDETGTWDANTAAKYNENRSLSVMDDELKRYYEEALASYELPTTDKEVLRKELETYLRPAYDKAIADRKKTTEESRALIDVDAYSRGMGPSTWVADAKTRQGDSEATDVSNMESAYAAALTQALLEQLNTNKTQELTAKNNAYTMALKLYELAQAQRAAQQQAVSYGGGGGGYVARNSGSSGSSSGRRSGSSSGGSSYTVQDLYDTIKSNETTQAVQGKALTNLINAYTSAAKQSSGSTKEQHYKSGASGSGNSRWA